MGGDDRQPEPQVRIGEVVAVTAGTHRVCDPYDEPSPLERSNRPGERGGRDTGNARDVREGSVPGGDGSEHGPVQAAVGNPREVDAVGATVVSDPSSRSSHEVDLVAVRNGAVVAVGEAKLRRLGRSDLARLERVRALLHAPEAEFVLASATGFESGLAGPGVRLIGLAEVYGNR